MSNRYRPEYVALAHELPFLRGAFGLPCTPETRGDVVITLAAFECLDRYYDAHDDAATRIAFGRDVLAALRAEPVVLPAQAAHHAGELRRTFLARGALAPMTRHLAGFLDATEQARTARSPRDYVVAVETEGRLTSQMVLLLLGDDPRFAAFFTRLGAVGNLVDKLCDARDDFATGQLALRPRVVYPYLAAALVVEAARLLATFPRRRSLAAWGMKYFQPLFSPRWPSSVRRGSRRATLDATPP